MKKVYNRTVQGECPISVYNLFNLSNPEIQQEVTLLSPFCVWLQNNKSTQYLHRHFTSVCSKNE
jgi:hypothetical protein